MNAPIPSELLLRRDPVERQLETTAGVQRYVWESKFGAMVIEVRDGRTYVNGALVESVAPERGAA